MLNQKSKNVSFYGTDIDGEVISDEIYNSDRCYIENRDFIKNPPQRKFKSIIANPPYIRHHRLDDDTKILLKKLSRRITGHNIDGRAGYHVYFLIQALNLLEINGRLAFIMPADICEGKFSENLWQWISENFCIDCIVSFEKDATPFPNVDTNALILLIKNAEPQENVFWVKVRRSYSTDLKDFIESGFTKENLGTIEVTHRVLKEGIATGLSRPEQESNTFKYHLSDFATIMRGIATGSNAFFFLNSQQVKDLGIPTHFLKRAVGRTKDITESEVTFESLQQLDKINRPTYLFSINGHGSLPESIKNYLKVGETMNLPNKALIQQRKPWYKMEKRKIPPILFAYLGRRNTRFIKNTAGVLPLTGFLCVYPFCEEENFINNLWQALNHPDTLKNLHLVGKSYGSGAIKVEPSNLSKLPIPSHIVKEFKLEQNSKFVEKQLDLFE